MRDWPDDAASADAETSATSVAPELNAGDVTDSTTADTTARSRTTATSSRTGGTATSAGRAATEIPAPRDGDYQYEVVEHVPAFEDEPAETYNDSYWVRWRVSRGAGVVTSDETEGFDDDDPTTSYVSSYRTTAATHELVKTVSSDEDGSLTCAYKPAMTLVNLPLTTGAQWHNDTTCSDSDGATEHTVNDGRVVGSATDVVGGKSVATVIVKTTETYTETYVDDEPGDAYIVRTERTTHIDPTTLLIVSEESTDTDDTGTTTSRLTLKNLEPRKT